MPHSVLQYMMTFILPTHMTPPYSYSQCMVTEDRERAQKNHRVLQAITGDAIASWCLTAYVSRQWRAIMINGSHGDMSDAMYWLQAVRIMYPYARVTPHGPMARDDEATTFGTIAPSSIPLVHDAARTLA